MSHITEEVEREREAERMSLIRERKIKEFYDDQPIITPIHPEGFDKYGNPIW